MTQDLTVTAIADMAQILTQDATRRRVLGRPRPGLRPESSPGPSLRRPRTRRRGLRPESSPGPSLRSLSRSGPGSHFGPSPGRSGLDPGLCFFCDHVAKLQIQLKEEKNCIILQGCLHSFIPILAYWPYNNFIRLFNQGFCLIKPC